MTMNHRLNYPKIELERGLCIESRFDGLLVTSKFDDIVVQTAIRDEQHVEDIIKYLSAWLENEPWEAQRMAALQTKGIVISTGNPNDPFARVVSRTGEFVSMEIACSPGRRTGVVHLGPSQVESIVRFLSTWLEDLKRGRHDNG